MTSRIGSRREYLIPTYGILLLSLPKFDSKSDLVADFKTLCYYSAGLFLGPPWERTKFANRLYLVEHHETDGFFALTLVLLFRRGQLHQLFHHSVLWVDVQQSFVVFDRRLKVAQVHMRLHSNIQAGPFRLNNTTLAYITLYVHTGWPKKVATTKWSKIVFNRIKACQSD